MLCKDQICRPNNSNVRRNNKKKVYESSTQETLKKKNDIAIIELVLHTKDIDIELVCLLWEIETNLGTDPLLKWETVQKKCRKYKVGDKYCSLWIKEKLAIASYNYPNELLNQSSEILKKILNT